MRNAPSQGCREQNTLFSPGGSLSPENSRNMENPPSPQQQTGSSNEVCGMGALASP